MSDGRIVAIYLISETVYVLSFLDWIVVLNCIMHATTSSLRVFDEHETDPESEERKPDEKENDDQILIIAAA